MAQTGLMSVFICLLTWDWQKRLLNMSEYVDAVIDYMLQAVTHWLNMFKEYYNG